MRPGDKSCLPLEALYAIVHLASSPWNQQPGPQSTNDYERGYYVGKQVGFEIAAGFAQKGLNHEQ